jgi:hypothetical protein
MCMRQRPDGRDAETLHGMACVLHAARAPRFGSLWISPTSSTTDRESSELFARDTPAAWGGVKP